MPIHQTKILGINSAFFTPGVSKSTNAKFKNIAFSDTVTLPSTFEALQTSLPPQPVIFSCVLNNIDAAISAATQANFIVVTYLAVGFLT